MTARATSTSERAGRGRWLVIAVLGAALVAVIAFVPRPGGGGSDPPADTTPTTTTNAEGPAIETSTADLDQARAEVVAAIDDLLATDSMTIWIESDLDGQIETFDIELDVAAQSYRSWETIGDVDGAVTVIERIETLENLYLRVVDDDDPSAEPRWNVIPIEVEEQLQLYRAYTAFGRITPALHDFGEMLMALDAQALATNADGASGYRLTLRADEVSRYIRDNDLAAMIVSDEVGATTFEFWLTDGRLDRLVATGVQWFTGEPFRNVRIDVTYTPGPVTVAAPALPVGPELPG